jgi:hypothetical protein
MRSLVASCSFLVIVSCGPPTIVPRAGSGESGSGGAAGASRAAGGSGGMLDSGALVPGNTVPGRGDGGGSGGGGPDGGADAPEPAVPRPAGPVPLPLVVTDHFAGRGWFGDGTVAKFFTPGSMMIQEVAGAAGLCGSRPPGAKGKCLRITYTPPAGLAAPPMGAFVGVYMLGVLAMPHPETVPPARPGEPNWGQEPGIPVMPGAKQVSFYAAGEQANLRVSFRAGTDRDALALPERTEILTPGWTKYVMPLAGGEIGPGLLGGFAWTIKDTTRPAVFYLDDIVWEADGPAGLVAPAGKRDGVRRVLFINQCKEPVWVGINSQMGVPEGGGFRLDPAQQHDVTVPGGLWSGRFWGRTGCQFDASGVGRCETGDCGGRLGCTGGGKTPATLAEITFSAGPPNPDFYDISMVDGYNLPLAIAPLAGSFVKTPGAAYDCLTPSCVSDLNATCPADLRLPGPGGKTVGCFSACEKYGTDQFCCRGAFGTAQTCPPFDASRTFKAACPTAYSYAYDDATSTFTCKGEDYVIWFCP